ncbi:hypothetical protein [Spirosoma linguale]|uniref:Uncharacterized protein n=1 Tax=Spirosoma linguale (strain ATCC 33905 / DSM 74 / LMG 10896 / Claus 1) TaxID=504472 RepID=D2QQN5_SPILD|nr:hypothetical protein Slin_4838 [Spirosoma linguale DSM 74]
MKAILLICIWVNLSTPKEHFQSISKLEDRFEGLVQKFKSGLVKDEDFIVILRDLNNLKKDINLEIGSDSEKNILMREVEAIHDFIGEVSPNGGNFDLTNYKKSIALSKFGLTEIIYSSKEYCMPISKIPLWNNRYTCYLMINNSDCLYRYAYSINVKNINKKGDVAVDKNSSRKLLYQYSDNPIKISSIVCTNTNFCR